MRFFFNAFFFSKTPKKFFFAVFWLNFDVKKQDCKLYLYTGLRKSIFSRKIDFLSIFSKKCVFTKIFFWRFLAEKTALKNSKKYPHYQGIFFLQKQPFFRRKKNFWSPKKKRIEKKNAFRMRFFSIDYFVRVATEK